MNNLTFAELRAANTLRLESWHTGAAWTGADWSNAMCGEAGEVANVVKKLRRIETGNPGSRDPDEDTLLSMLWRELADVVIYLDLLADHYGLDLGACVVKKFNEVSEGEGFPQRL